MEGEFNLNTAPAGMTDDDFALAFDAVANGESFDKPIADKPAEGQPIAGKSVEDQPVVNAPDGDHPVVDKPVAEQPVADKAATEKAAAEKAAADKAAADRAAADRAAAEKAAADRAAADRVAADRAAADKAAADRAAAEKAAADREQFTAEEQAAITEATTNFPEVVGAMKAMERVLQARYENMLAARLTEVAARYEQQLAPITQSIQSTVQDKHIAAIVGVHKDAFEILPAVETWVDTQPSILRGAYNRVLDQGTSAEVVELLDAYKRATGVVAQPTVAAGPTPEEAEKQRKLAAQEGVRGRHTAGERTNAVDPNDFEGAFEKFAA